MGAELSVNENSIMSLVIENNKSELFNGNGNGDFQLIVSSFPYKTYLEELKYKKVGT